MTPPTRSPLLLALLLTACGADQATGPTPSSPDPAPTDDATETTPPPGAAQPTGPGATSPSPSPTTPPTTPAYPAGLTCLAGHYTGTPARAPNLGDVLTLPDGLSLPWDDGQPKTFEQKLATADLEDTLAMPYPTGPIVPVTTVDQDPGRIRNDALFKAAFGSTQQAVQAKLVNVTFVGQTVKFHTRAAAALARVSQRLELAIAQDGSLAQYVTGELGGTFEWRPIANTNRLSAHSYGIAIDIVVSRSNYWEWEKQGGVFTWKNKIPQKIVDAFEAEGFAWGGRWYHYDTMHFEYRPELFDAACK